MNAYHTNILWKSFVAIGIAIPLTTTSLNAQRESIRSLNRYSTRGVKSEGGNTPSHMDVNRKEQGHVEIHRHPSVDLDIDRHLDVDVNHGYGNQWHHGHVVVVGTVVKTVPASRIVIVVGGAQYCYSGGVYYLPTESGYVVVPSPVGAVIGTLPAGCVTIVSGSHTYYYYNGTFYMNHEKGFIVVSVPTGVTITTLPVGANRFTMGGVVHYHYCGVYYRPSFSGGITVYTSVRL